MKLLLLEPDESEIVIAESDDEKELNKIMMDYISNELHFECYYTRSWFVPEENRTIVDYGSHARFFAVEY